MHTYTACLHRISARRRVVPLGPQLTLVVGQDELGGVGGGVGAFAAEDVVVVGTMMTVTGVVVMMMMVVVVIVAAWEPRAR